VNVGAHLAPQCVVATEGVAAHDDGGVSGPSASRIALIERCALPRCMTSATESPTKCGLRSRMAPIRSRTGIDAR